MFYEVPSSLSAPQSLKEKWKDVEAAVMAEARRFTADAFPSVTNCSMKCMQGRGRGYIVVI